MVKRALALAAVLGTFGAVLVAAGVIAATPEQPKSIILGKTENYPVSGCPDPGRCEVVARVTGIQMRADGVQHPFRTPSSGQLVAWWLRLPRMRSTQIQSFSDLFGGGPAARVAVLRRGVRGRIRLIRQSTTQVLRAYLTRARRVHFRIDPPLRVKAGDYVGLSAVTWVPAFATGLDPLGDVWLASRPKPRCDTPSSRNPDSFAKYYKTNDAQLEASTVKRYRCRYRTARLLYWARITPDPVEPEPEQRAQRRR
jgi:hypothetical protein